MYLRARKNVNLIKKIIDIDLEMHDIMSSAKFNKLAEKLKIDNLNKKLIGIIKDCEIEDLKVIYTISSIGLHERGYREYTSKSERDIIELEIKEDKEQLLLKYSKFISFHTKDELENYLIRCTSISTQLIEGLKILKLI